MVPIYRLVNIGDRKGHLTPWVYDPASFLLARRKPRFFILPKLIKKEVKKMTDEVQSILGSTVQGAAAGASQQYPFATFIVVIIAFIVLAFGAGIFFLIKGGHISWNKDKKKSNEPAKSEKTEDSSKPTESSNKEKINILKRIISDSVKSGYDRCSIRQELFDEQVKVMNNNLGVILSTIASSFKNKCGGDINMQYYIESLFDEKICIRLKQVFKKDNLATKTEEQVIDSNRDIIDDAFTNIKNELSLKGFDDNYLKILDDHKEILNEKIKFILKDARRLAREKKDELDELHNIFASEQKATIANFIDVSEEELKDLTSSLTLPPNDIIGEMN